MDGFDQLYHPLSLLTQIPPPFLLRYLCPKWQTWNSRPRCNLRQLQKLSTGHPNETSWSRHSQFSTTLRTGWLQ